MACTCLVVWHLLDPVCYVTWEVTSPLRRRLFHWASSLNPFQRFTIYTVGLNKNETAMLILLSTTPILVWSTIWLAISLSHLEHDLRLPRELTASLPPIFVLHIFSYVYGGLYLTLFLELALGLLARIAIYWLTTGIPMCVLTTGFSCPGCNADVLCQPCFMKDKGYNPGAGKTPKTSLHR